MISSIAAWFELSPAAGPLLLAARRSFRGASVSWVVGGAIAVAAIVVVWLLTRWWLGEGSARMRNTPRALFTELCRAHALVSAERQLLVALAECRQLVQPGELFVNPSHFDEQRLSAALAPRKAELRALRARLFEGLETLQANVETTLDVAPSPIALAKAGDAQNASPALN